MVCHGSNQYTPFMLAYIPATWIRHGLCLSVRSHHEIPSSWNMIIPKQSHKKIRHCITAPRNSSGISITGEATCSGLKHCNCSFMPGWTSMGIPWESWRSMTHVLLAFSDVVLLRKKLGESSCTSP